MVASVGFGESWIFCYLIIISHTLICCCVCVSVRMVHSLAMTEEGEVGKDPHPLGGYTTDMFNDVSSVNKFAAEIGAPKKVALHCMTPHTAWTNG